MKRLLFGLIALILLGCAAQPAVMQKNASLPDLGPARELTNDTWLNVGAPLRLANLCGKVVLIDM